MITLVSASDQSVGRLTSQALSLGFALVLMWAIANIAPQRLARVALPLYLVAVALLVAVAVGGTLVNGSRRWLSIGIAPLPAFRADEDRAAIDARLVFPAARDPDSPVRLRACAGADRGAGRPGAAPA